MLATTRVAIARCGWAAAALLFAAQAGAGDVPDFDEFVLPLAHMHERVMLADVTGDGLDDLTVRGYHANATCVVHTSLGDGTFGPGSPPTDTLHGVGADLTDVDADGRADLLDVDGGQVGTQIHLSLGDGTFAPPSVAYYGVEPNEAVVADLNGDGHLDLIQSSGEGWSCCHVVTWLGHGDGSFHSQHVLDLWSLLWNELGADVSSLRPMDAADLDGDGRVDLVVGEYGGTVATLRGQGDGTFAEPTILASSSDGVHNGIDLGDLDNDGDVDALTTRRMGLGGPFHLVGFLNHGGTFGEGIVSPADSQALGHLALADLDVDGWLDAASYDDSGPWLACGRGDASFAAPLHLGVSASEISFVHTGDVDGDGVADLAYLAESPYAAVVITNLSPGPALPAVGQALAAGSGVLPKLVGLGTLEPGSTLELVTSQAPPLTFACLVLGLSALHVPFKGGTLVPMPDVIAPGLPVDAEGQLGLTFGWPGDVPAGTSLWLQLWIPDVSAAHGYAATNGVRGTQP